MKKTYEDLVNRYGGVWLFAVPLAIVWILFSLLGIYKKQRQYFVNVFYFLDLLVNALSGGHVLITVSARVGMINKYYELKRKRGHKRTFTSCMWKLYEKVINYAFYPIDQEDHCFKAYLWTKLNVCTRDIKHVTVQHGPMVLVLLLGLIVLVSAALLAIIIRACMSIGISFPSVDIEKEYEKYKKNNTPA